MACLAAGLEIAWVLVRSRALCTASVTLRIVSAMATAAMDVTMTSKTAAGTLRDVPCDVALRQVIAGLVIARSSLLLCLIFWHRPEGLIVFRIEAQSSLRLNPCHEAGIKEEEILTLLDCSKHLWM